MIEGIQVSRRQEGIRYMAELFSSRGFSSGTFGKSRKAIDLVWDVIWLLFSFTPNIKVLKISIQSRVSKEHIVVDEKQKPEMRFRCQGIKTFWSDLNTVYEGKYQNADDFALSSQEELAVVS